MKHRIPEIQSSILLADLHIHYTYILAYRELRVFADMTFRHLIANMQIQNSTANVFKKFKNRGSVFSTNSSANGWTKFNVS